ncbi:MAG: peptidylprolyl isomerase [Dehalococcoidia bacterium]
MAGARQSKASHRREREARESRQQERVTLISIGVLVAVAIIAAAGVVWGIVLPPRATVLTVGNETFTASDAKSRAVFLIAGNEFPEEPLDAAVDMLTREAILLQVGAPKVGEITGDDVTKAIRERIGIPEDASAQDVEDRIKAFLEVSRIDRPTFERIVRAEVVADRLGQTFNEAIGTAGPQYHLMGVAGSDQAKVKELRAAVAGGADITTKALEMKLIDSKDTPDLGWSLPPTGGYLKDTVKVDELQAGQPSEVHENSFRYEFYFMAERDEKRTYTDEQLDELRDRKVDEWVQQQRDQVKVTEDVSNSERRWILSRVTEEAAAIAEARAKLGGVTSAPIRVGQ